MKPWQLVQSLRNLKWLLTVRRACSSAYAKFKLNSSGCSNRGNETDLRGGSAVDNGRSVGVMELVDEVSECKYSDVHVMWSILKEAEKRHQQAAAMASAINQPVVICA